MRENSRVQYRRIQWLICLAYLNGARNFSIWNPDSGALRWSHTDEEGRVEFQSGEMLKKISEVAGRLEALDLLPFIKSTGKSLQGAKDRAVAQVFADHLVGEDQLEDVKRRFAHIFTALGSAGVAGHIIEHPTIGLTSDIEVIHPSELFPFPSEGNDYTKRSGIMRERWVPFGTLKEHFPRKKWADPEIWNRMDWAEVHTGSAQSSLGEDGVADLNAGAPFEIMGGKGSGLQGGAGRGGQDGSKGDTTRIIKIRELWIEGPKQLCTRYVMTSGKQVLSDQDYSGIEMYCPIGFSTFFETGTFHGAGLFDLLFPVLREHERLVKDLFNNIRELDRYGVLVMPSGQINHNDLLKDVGHGLRVMFWEPDPMAEGFTPFPIQPYNARDIPGRVAAMAKQLADGLSPLQDLLTEKGRVDSASGLAILDESINRAMTNPTTGIRQAFGMMYRELVRGGLAAVVGRPQKIPVSRLTMELAGIVMDPEDDTISFPENPIPDLTKLTFSVRESSPRLKMARMGQAVELHEKMGLFQTDPDSFFLTALEEGMDFPVWMGEHESAWQTLQRNILILFGDGESPGQLILTPHTAKPGFQIRGLNKFLANPIMAQASVDVVDSFLDYRDTLMEFMGLVLPAAVPNPEDTVALNPSQAMPAGMPPIQG